MRYDPQPGDTIVLELVTGTKLTMQYDSGLIRERQLVTLNGIVNGSPTSVSVNTVASLKIVN